MEEEMKSILKNSTWEHATLPAGHRAIGLKWVYKIKRDPAGNIVKHKARSVAKGYAHRQGIDFDEVFASARRGCTPTLDCSPYGCEISIP
jgi:hypothetical protein